MKVDALRYSKFGLTNALLSLIPIFPTWTLFPGVLLGSAVGNMLGDCQMGYSTILWSSFALTAFLLLRYFNKFEIGEGNSENQLKKNFRLFSLWIYTLLNTAILIIIIGTKLACYGDGQTLLACIFSGPLASIGLVLLGVAVDLKIRTSAPDKVDD